MATFEQDSISDEIEQRLNGLEDTPETSKQEYLDRIYFAELYIWRDKTWIFGITPSSILFYSIDQDPTSQSKRLPPNDANDCSMGNQQAGTPWSLADFGFELCLLLVSGYL